MQLIALQTIAQHLARDHVRYLIAGGMAVVAHGYGRMTVDIDLVVKLEPDNIKNAFKALAVAGYRPRVPITPDQFADPSIRAGWIKDKGMVVLNLWSDQFRDTPVDIFVTEPFDFETAYAQALEETLENGLLLRFVNIPTLLRMKRAAGREKDLDDIRHLEILAREC